MLYKIHKKHSIVGEKQNKKRIFKEEYPFIFSFLNKGEDSFFKRE